jgi:hypothetical protein
MVRWLSFLSPHPHLQAISSSVRFLLRYAAMLI